MTFFPPAPDAAHSGPMARFLFILALLLAPLARAEGPAAPRPIQVGIYLNQLSALDLKARSF